MGTYIKPVTRIDHIHATGINFSLQLFSATIMISSGAFLLTLFVLSGAKVMGKGKGVFRQADFTEDIAIMGNGGSIFCWLKLKKKGNLQLTLAPSMVENWPLSTLKRKSTL